LRRPIRALPRPAPSWRFRCEAILYAFLLPLLEIGNQYAMIVPLTCLSTPLTLPCRGTVLFISSSRWSAVYVEAIELACAVVHDDRTSLCRGSKQQLAHFPRPRIYWRLRDGQAADHME